MQQILPRSPEFTRLNEETRKGRISQYLTQSQIKQLASRISAIQVEQLLRFILKQKSFFKRSIIDVYILMACIRKYSFFDNVLEGKGQKALQQICKHLYYTTLEQGKYLYEIGDVADRFYIIMTGSVSVQVAYRQQIITETGETKTVQMMKQAMKYTKGQMFGETISKQSIARRAASIQTETNCQFFEVKKKDYETVNKYMTISLMRQKYTFFEQIDLFSRLHKSSLESMLYLTVPKIVHMGHTLYNQGQQIDEIYIIKQGQFKLQSLIFGQQNYENPFAKLQKRSSQYSRKFQTSIVGSKFVLGQIDVLMNIPTMESCTCITEKAYLYVIKKKDLMIHMQQSNIVQGYVVSKYYLRNNRLKKLNKSYNKNSSILSIFGYKKETSQSRSLNKSYQRHTRSLNKIQNQDQSYEFINKNRSKRGSTTFYDKKRCSTQQNIPSFNNQTFNINNLTEMVKQKKKYSKIRKNNNEPLFKFSNEIPVFLRVKMGVQSNTLKTDEANNTSFGTLTQFLSPKKISQTVRPPRKIIKKEPRVSANSRTVYGKFFQLLLNI